MNKNDDDFNLKDYINNFYEKEVYNRKSFGLYDENVERKNISKKHLFHNVKVKKNINKDDTKKKSRLLDNIKAIFAFIACLFIPKNRKKKKARDSYRVSPNKRKKNRKGFFKIILILILAIILFIAGMYLYNDSKKIKIVLDAGHGGTDVGATKNERYEKNDTLEIVNLIYNNLSNDDRIKVILTRDKDEYVSLKDRCKISNKKKAKLFISFHRNDSEAGNGIEIWLPSDYNEREEDIAGNILGSLEKSNISRNRGIKVGTETDKNTDYYINQYTNADSMIIELGFISSAYDNTLLDQNKNDYAKKISECINIALEKYYIEKEDD